MIITIKNIETGETLDLINEHVALTVETDPEMKTPSDDDAEHDFECDSATFQWWDKYNDNYCDAEKQWDDACLQASDHDVDVDYYWDTIKDAEFNDLPGTLIWCAERLLKDLS
jgi:hypothetical protein